MLGVFASFPFALRVYLHCIGMQLLLLPRKRISVPNYIIASDMKIYGSIGAYNFRLLRTQNKQRRAGGRLFVGRIPLSDHMINVKVCTARPFATMPFNCERINFLFRNAISVGAGEPKKKSAQIYDRTKLKWIIIIIYIKRDGAFDVAPTSHRATEQSK